jgi:hypothetical protein
MYARAGLCGHTSSAYFDDSPLLPAAEDVA